MLFVRLMRYLHRWTIILALALVSRPAYGTLHRDAPTVPDYVTRYGMYLEPTPLLSKSMEVRDTELASQHRWYGFIPRIPSGLATLHSTSSIRRHD